MTKRKARSQTANLTPNYKKSRITLIYLNAGGVPHIVEKLSTRATTLLQTSSQLKVYKRSYGLPKLRKT
jgi:hypothetical protein